MVSKLEMHMAFLIKFKIWCIFSNKYWISVILFCVLHTYKIGLLAQQVTVRVKVKRHLLYLIQKPDTIMVFANKPDIVNKTPGMTYKCLDPRYHPKFPLV